MLKNETCFPLSTFSLVLDPSSIKGRRKLNATNLEVKTPQSDQPPPTCFPSPWPSRDEWKVDIPTMYFLTGQWRKQKVNYNKVTLPHNQLLKVMQLCSLLYLRFTKHTYVSLLSSTWQPYMPLETTLYILQSTCIQVGSMKVLLWLVLCNLKDGELMNLPKNYRK